MEGAVAPPDPWDWVVRITHWSIVAAVIANGLVDRPGGTLHVWIGWGVMAILLVRALWGFVGPTPARFSAFVPAPRAAISHLVDLVRGRRSKTYGSHNPAGSLMVYALWGLLAVLVVTGLVMTGARTPVTIAKEKAAVAAGDWGALVKAGDGDHDEAAEFGDVAQEIHAVASNLILVLALVHVLGVVVEGRVMRRSLVRPMIVGRRRE